MIDGYKRRSKSTTGYSSKGDSIDHRRCGGKTEPSHHHHICTSVRGVFAVGKGSGSSVSRHI